MKGFVRAALTDVRGAHKGRVQTTDWMPNLITNDGFAQYVLGYGTSSGAKTVTHMGLGSSSAAPTASMTALVGEFTGADGARGAITGSVISSTTFQATASWATNLATQSVLGSIGLFNTSSGGTACSVASLTATSQKTTDQTLSVTYQHRFATA